MKKWPQLIVSLFFLGYVIWWISFQHVVKNQGLAVQWYGGTYGILALMGSLSGFVAAHKWGGLKTVLGRALTLFSCGLLAQEAGQLIYTYYIYGAKIQIPYPSWGDAAYFSSVLLYICAAIMLSRMSGVKFSLRKSQYKLIALLVPVILLAVTYWIFLHNHQYDSSNPLSVFLDFGYPVGQALYISVAVTAYLLSLKLLGGVMKHGILMVIFALFIQYIADFTFIYQSSRDTYLSGEIVDLIYLVSYYAMAMAMLQFLQIHYDLRRKIRPTREAKQSVTAEQ